MAKTAWGEVVAKKPASSVRPVQSVLRDGHRLCAALSETSLSQEQGLALVKELGYDGVAWLEKSPDAVKSDLAEIEKHGLKMYAIYSHAQVAPNGDLTVSKDAVPVMKVLKGHCDIFWIHISGKGPAFDTLSGKEPLWRSSDRLPTRPRPTA